MTRLYSLWKKCHVQKNNEKIFYPHLKGLYLSLYGYNSNDSNTLVHSRRLNVAEPTMTRS